MYANIYLGTHTPVEISGADNGGGISGKNGGGISSTHAVTAQGHQIHPRRPQPDTTRPHRERLPFTY